MYLGIAIAVGLIEFVLLIVIAVHFFVQKRTIYKSIVSVGKVPIYLRREEDELRGHQTAIKLLVGYLDFRMSSLVSQQNSDIVVNGRAQPKSIEQIYSERGEIQQLGHIRTYLNSLIVKEKK